MDEGGDQMADGSLENVRSFAEPRIFRFVYLTGRVYGNRWAGRRRVEGINVSMFRRSLDGRTGGLYTYIGLYCTSMRLHIPELLTNKQHVRN